MLDDEWRDGPDGAARNLLAARAFLRACIEEARRAERYDRPLSVALIHVDSICHGRKERVAQVVANLDRLCRAPDRLGRLDPSRLGLLMPETRIADALRAAERLRVGADVRGARLSIGIAAVSVRLRDARLLLMLASAELNRARRAGGGIFWAVPERLATTLPRSRHVH